MKQWNLIRLRHEAGINQKEMAELLGMSEYAYMRREDGQTPFRDFEMFMIRDIFDKPIEEIFLRRDCNDIAVGTK